MPDYHVNLGVNVGRYGDLNGGCVWFRSLG